jgi:hypothetical protein
MARIHVKLGQPAKQAYELAQAQFAAVGMDHLVAQCRQETKRPSHQQSSHSFWLWSAAGLTIALLIYWLKR